MDVSNRYGRTPIIAFILFAFLVGDSIFLFTVYYVDKVSIYMILVSGVVEGFGGGLMTMMALTNAYIADATPTGSRSGTFSLVGGCLFGGIGLGPSWGAILIRIFGHNPLAPYVLALACYSFCVMSLLTFVPESLSWSRRLSYREEKAQRLTATAKSFWRNTFGFLRPLRLLLPHRTYEATLVSHQNPPQSHLDWTLTKIAMAYAMVRTCRTAPLVT